MKIAPGIYREMPDAEYREIDALSNSGLIAWAKGDGGDTIKRSNADFGTAFHAVVLEPDVAASRIVRLQPKQQRKSYVGPDDALVFTNSEYIKLMGCYESFKDHPQCGRILEAARADRPNCEVVLVWEDESTGLLCKARVDFVTDNAVYDIKTSSSDPDSFPKSIAAFGYACQGAHYLSGAAACGLPARVFRFAVSCKRGDKGHVSWVHELGETEALHGQVERARLLNLYSRFGKESHQ